jgi:hypothetical protein
MSQCPFSAVIVTGAEADADTPRRPVIGLTSLPLFTSPLKDRLSPTIDDTKPPITNTSMLTHIPDSPTQTMARLHTLLGPVNSADQARDASPSTPTLKDSLVRIAESGVGKEDIWKDGLRAGFLTFSSGL